MTKHLTATLTAAAAALALGAGPAAAEIPNPADARYLVPEGKVEHSIVTVKVEGSRAAGRSERHERWLTRTSSRLVVTDLTTGKVRLELVATPHETQIYEREGNRLTITRSKKAERPPHNSQAFDAAVNRAYVEDGIAQVTGETQVGGRRALILEPVAGKWQSDEPTSRTVTVVDAETYATLERTTGLPEGKFGQREIRQVTELLSAAKAKARLAMAKHPGAKIKRR